MPPLITREEALELGELEDRAEIEALVERAWQARVERFGDSTDMCSLVNAKSGGCAEDCGFCAQSRFAEAETPMHAMMEPEQILEHARAAEAAGAHRFCMVTQGQGLSKRDFEKVLEGARLVAEHTNLKRCASVGHMSRRRARRRCKEAGIQRVHHNVETAESYYPEVSHDRPLRGPAAHDRRGRARPAWRPASAASSTSARRASSASRWPSSSPRSTRRACRSTCSTRAPARSSATASYMDPWEAVKWIAIFRLILPDALFRLCGGRVENLGELQPLAVKAGINGVMMGNFLTTLGNTPEEDRAMFEELGLNVARQPDNGANPRPDNRTGWLEGETPDVVEDCTSTTRRRGRRASRSRLWDPVDAAALRAQARRPAAPRRRAERDRLASADAGGSGAAMTEIAGTAGRARAARPVPAHAPGQRPAGPARRARRQAGAAAVLEQLPRPGRPPARARGGRRRGDALGRRRGRVAPGVAAR